MEVLTCFQICGLNCAWPIMCVYIKSDEAPTKAKQRGSTTLRRRVVPQLQLSTAKTTFSSGKAVAPEDVNELVAGNILEK